MAKAARKDDRVNGPATGEHNGHLSSHTGEINPSKIDNVSNSTVYINSKLAATKGDTSRVSDNCDNNIITQTIVDGSSTVYISGKQAARKDDKLTPHHNSQIKIEEGSDNVEIGG